MKGRQLAVAVAGVAFLSGACSVHTTTRATGSTLTTESTESTEPTTTSTEAVTSTTAPPVDVEPASAAEAAASVSAAEQAIRAGDRDERWGRQQQVAYRTLVTHPEWMTDALKQVPPPLRPVVQANVNAGSQLRQLTKPKPALPPWKIVDPAPAEELLAAYKAAEHDTGVPWTYLAAIHLVETKMGRIRGASDAGAKGPMQFLPATWAQYGNGGDIESNHDSIEAAGRLLRHNGAPQRMSDALFSYNHSPLYVGAVTLYAQQMQADERAFFGYYQWRVYYRLQSGDQLLATGYDHTDHT